MAPARRPAVPARPHARTNARRRGTINGRSSNPHRRTRSMSTSSHGITRRQAIQTAALAAAAFATGSFPLGWARAADGKTKKVLFFTKSSGFQHSVVTRSKDAPDKLAHAEQVLTDLGKQHGFDVTVTKDGSVFTPEKLAEFDVIAFYTTGDLDKKDKDPAKDSKD